MTPRRRASLDRSAWISAARAALIAGGIGAVKIGRLASRLRVTRESFYWHFGNLQALHRALLDDWEEGNSAGFHALIDPVRRSGRKEYRALIALWIDERDFLPAWDAAVRDWARVAPAVARRVRKVDLARIAIIERIFHALGARGTTAHVAARVTYYHQVGYYALGIRESARVRRRLTPVYAQILTGRRISLD